MKILKKWWFWVFIAPPTFVIFLALIVAILGLAFPSDKEKISNDNTAQAVEETIKDKTKPEQIPQYIIKKDDESKYFEFIKQAVRGGSLLQDVEILENNSLTVKYKNDLNYFDTGKGMEKTARDVFFKVFSNVKDNFILIVSFDINGITHEYSINRTQLKEDFPNLDKYSTNPELYRQDVADNLKFSLKNIESTMNRYKVD